VGRRKGTAIVIASALRSDGSLEPVDQVGQEVALTSIRMGCLKLRSGGYQQSNLEGETAMTDPNPIYTELLAEKEAAEADSDGDQDTLVDAE
jgi:hypothetical protein